MKPESLVSYVYIELERLNACGFKTWLGKAWELASSYNLDICSELNLFKSRSKDIIMNKFKQDWQNSINNNILNPITRTYKTFKTEPKFEAYLDITDNINLRKTLTRFRTSSHALQIELGRQTNIKAEQRFCPICKNKVEDEFHFLIECPFYNDNRKIMYDAFSDVRGFYYLSNYDIFHTILSSSTKCHILGLAKYLHESFNKRAALLTARE